MGACDRSGAMSVGPPTGDASPRGPLYNIQALRGVAAILVVFVHMPGMLGAIGWHRFGAVGVELFFVISGFVAVYSTESGSTPRRFMGHRLWRVVPMYWLATAATVIAAITIPGAVHATRPAVEEIIKSLAFIPFEKANGLVKPVLFVGWTLEYEMLFYLIFAAALLAPDRRVGLAAVCAVMFGLVGLGAIIHPTDVIVRYFTNPVMVNFVWGIALGAFWRRLPSGLWPVYAPALLLSLFLLLWLPSGRAWPAGEITGLLAAIAVASAIGLEMSGIRAPTRLAVLAGAISYSLYLTHPFITVPAEALQRRFGLTGALDASALVATVLVACAVGAAVHYGVDRPMVNMRRPGRRPAVVAMSVTA